MAVILGICDPDERRRAQVRARLPASLSGLPPLARRSALGAGIDVHWDASPSTPVSVVKQETPGRRTLAFVVGDFDAAYAAESNAAQRLLDDMQQAASPAACIAGRNGYYLAALFDDSPRLVLGADALGLFPLYYWTQGGVCLFGTSPELFRFHPSFTARPCLYGIASVLLVNHIGAGRSLYEGVRRAGCAHAVEWTPATGVREIIGRPVRMSDARFGARYEVSREHVAASLDAFHRARAGLPRADLFLSGGQDSRTVAGYMDRHLRRDAVRAVSLGVRSDQELRYARAVTRTLGWPHAHRDVAFERYPESATMQVRLEALQGPFASFDTYTARAMLAERGGPFFSGYLGDPVVGDGQVNNAISPITGEIGFDPLFETANRYGFTREDAARLLPGREGRRALDAVVEDLRADWNAIDASAFQKAWLFAMTHRIRFHVGSIVWRLSLGAWPLLPYYDRSLLDIVTAMPLNHLRGRRMQVDIIKRDFPRLATLPLDRNSTGPDYLVRPLYRKFVPPLSDVSWTLHRLLDRGREHRYYHRTYDFNGSGWQAVRRHAEPHRRHAQALLDATALDALLPRPDERPQYANAVADASKTKTLLGLVLWCGTTFATTSQEDARVDALTLG